MTPTQTVSWTLALTIAIGTVALPARAGDAEQAQDGAQRLWDLLEKKYKDETKGEAWLNRKFTNDQWWQRIQEREVPGTPSPAPRGRAEELPSEGVVTDCTDGDTLKVEGVGPIRLQGVDTTEKLHPTKPVQYMSAEASKFTRELVCGKRVRLEYGDPIRDKYGRVLAFIYLPDGRMLNAELIKNGFGYAYTRFPFKYKKEFVKLEAQAQEKGVGLWADNGMGEYNWLRAQKREDFEVFEMSESLWGVQFGDMALLRLTTDQLRLELEVLRKDVHTLGPRDLEKELAARGYQKVPKAVS